MQLMMYLGNDLIESVPINPGNLQKPGYLGNFKRNLKMKYKELIGRSTSEPEFLVINSDPKISQAFQEALKKINFK